MTYRELIDALSRIPDERLDDDVTVELSQEDECFSWIFENLRRISRLTRRRPPGNFCSTTLFCIDPDTMYKDSYSSGLSLKDVYKSTETFVKEIKETL
jgi:hypothetical protein